MTNSANINHGISEAVERIEVAAKLIDRRLKRLNQTLERIADAMVAGHGRDDLLEPHVQQIVRKRDK